MFIGHYGIGLAGKKPGPEISLGTLFLASQWLDLLWPLMLIFNLEHVSIVPGNTKMVPLDFDYYPFSHSLVFVLVWSFLFGGFYYMFRGSKRNSLILGLLVLSHWILDLFVHKPDLPLFPSGPMEGFGLWNFPVIAIPLESLIFAAGVYLYTINTKPKNKNGIYVFWSLITFLIIIHIINLLSPPPPNINSIAYASLALWLLIPWAYWADRNREYIPKEEERKKKEEESLKDEDE